MFSYKITISANTEVARKVSQTAAAEVVDVVNGDVFEASILSVDSESQLTALLNAGDNNSSYTSGQPPGFSEGDSVSFQTDDEGNIAITLFN